MKKSDKHLLGLMGVLLLLVGGIYSMISSDSTPKKVSTQNQVKQVIESPEIAPDAIKERVQDNYSEPAFVAPEPVSKKKVIQYQCSGDRYNCGDFNTQATAQEAFTQCGGVNNDIHRLDQDGNGVACETLH